MESKLQTDVENRSFMGLTSRPCLYWSGNKDILT